ncbi:Cytochrome P450 [Penicillium cf. griseofulvum]|uniref:Cytochrome P450 n=1 Tax=Penicillium cf. griseofulvum TaxID=2972120 RepID=A0A9W9MQK1_9EURO|nr:Cytochrome P450 [Penicillium cf. griseofulvum]KAJ5441301.1 Cytochrome P450 [Penicillium cf. griseofulvum]KAJ5449354.1 Cytochrome P450 [Penicillium cf. griseofulvum]
MAVITELLNSPYVVQGVCIALVAVCITSVWADIANEIPHRRIPLVGKTWWDLTNKKARLRFTQSSRQLIAEGFAKGANVFQIIGATSPMIVLHPKFVDEIKNNPDLSFEDSVKSNFFNDRIPGFEPFHNGTALKVTVEVVRTSLTQALGSISLRLSKEAGVTLKKSLPATDEWKPYHIAFQIPHMVAHVSSLIFVGETISHDDEWIDVSVNYAIDAFGAMRALREWPSVLRPVVHWFLPATRKLRMHLKMARSIISREIDRRALIRAGKLPEDDPPRGPDALDWYRETAEARNNLTFDQSCAQVGLALAAIHTTSNLLTNVLYDLAAYPEYIQPLRDEIRAVAAEDGTLKKTSLLKLKLMDSVMKETQRTHPLSLTSMNRLALRRVVLSDGTVIPKGANMFVSTKTLEDDSIYPNAATYDGYRFYNKRQQPGNEHKHQFVATSTEHFVFGHGVHACPGRFFAANETKILLLHFLLKYDWKVESGGRPPNIENGVESIPDPRVQILFRLREPEIDLGFLGE